MGNRFKTLWFQAPLYSESRAAGIFGNKTEKVYDSRNVDINQFSTLLENACNELDASGYDVVNVIPVASGTSDRCLQKGGNYVGDVGFSITQGAVVLGRKRD